MRVLIDGRMYQGKMHGLARYVFVVLREMARLKPDWEFGALDCGGHFADLARDQRNVIPIPVESQPFSLREHFELPTLINEWNPAVFHAPTIAVPSGLRCRMVATLPDLTTYHFGRWWKERLYFKLYLAPLLRRCRKIIVYSQHTASDACNNLGLSPDSFVVCPLGVEPRFSVPATETERKLIRDRFRLSRPYLLCVANPKPHKNLAGLIRAWQLAQQLAARTQGFLQQFDLVVVSSACPSVDEAAEHDSSIKRLERVADEDLPILYQEASLMVMPSLYEGFGLPVVEAMAAGAPVLSANTTSLPEVVGDAGRLVDPGNDQAFAQGIIDILADPGQLVDLSARGREHAASFTWERAAKIHLQAYLDAIQ